MRMKKMITKEKMLQFFLSKSRNLFFKKMCGDQSGEFVCGYWCFYKRVQEVSKLSGLN